MTAIPAANNVPLRERPAFQALSTDYRLQLPYLARVICLEGAAQPVGVPVATVAGGLGRLDDLEDAVAP